MPPSLITLETFNPRPRAGGRRVDLQPLKGPSGYRRVKLQNVTSVILSLRSFLVDKSPGVKQQWKFDKGGHGEIIPLLEEVIEEPYEIWLTPQKDQNGKIRLTKRYISLWKTEDKKRIGGLVVFEVVDGVLQGVTAFKPLRKGKPDLRYLEAQRSGVLLYRKGR